MSAEPRLKLAQLLASGSPTESLSAEDAAQALGELLRLQSRLAERMSQVSVEATRNAQVESERLLTPSEAAALLGVKVRWLYRHAHQFAFTRRLSRKMLRFHEPGLHAYLRKKSP